MISWCVFCKPKASLKRSNFKFAELLCFFWANTLQLAFFTGRSVVWLARLLWEQEAVSSNLTVPTIPSYRYGSNPKRRFSWILPNLQSRLCNSLHMRKAVGTGGLLNLLTEWVLARGSVFAVLPFSTCWKKMKFPGFILWLPMKHGTFTEETLSSCIHSIKGATVAKWLGIHANVPKFHSSSLGQGPFSERSLAGITTTPWLVVRLHQVLFMKIFSGRILPNFWGITPRTQTWSGS